MENIPLNLHGGNKQLYDLALDIHMFGNLNVGRNSGIVGVVSKLGCLACCVQVLRVRRV
jgi:hypothetical protein